MTQEKRSLEEPSAQARGVYTASESSAGARIDVELTRRTGFSRSHVATAIRAGAASVNGEPAKPSRILEPGDTVTYTIAPPAVLEVRPEAVLLDILFEDETLLVVNKPAGMVTHPAHGALDGTLVNALLAHTGALPGDPLRAGLVHRLDRDTSGLLLVAKTEAALGTLGRAMQKRYIKREYRGIVAGVPRELDGVIRGAIGRDPHNRLKYAIRADGKPAVTHYTLRTRLRDAAELTLTLETGRTHQIRVHFAALGFPIFNDPIYGKRDPRSPLPGQALHAWRLGFKHPQTKEHLSFEVEPPPAYLATLDVLAP
ncbi:MAG TPA: RluA family pseudouridine synthase [Candidatus Lustribacter sp.]|jgi:23S rRNA pseudouridine1911/1915/1917 synthase|nr:RluA family pseudouridine synthase [Candidatus Lustribacter sp.]